ncbi:MAG: Lrp/AsnC family transcriptional regulator [Nitrospirae bacterium]|nr:Lrp/AsnC family transcriptional regulator [Nitrospirota bacterium]
MEKLDAVDRRLLNLLQADFPLVPEPFAAIGKDLGIAEADVLERIGRLKAEKIIRQISAIFDTRALGYASSLVAARVPAGRLEEAAAVINEHPGVSHNYRRNDAFNLWFTIAVPPDSRLGLERTVERLGELAGAESIRLLPTLRLFKIGVKLDMTGEGDPANQAEAPAYTDKERAESLKTPITEDEIRVIRVIQKDFPIVPRPYDGLAKAAGLSLDAFLDAARRFIERRQLRRVAAVLHHRAAGFKANAMGIWAVPPDRVEKVGVTMAGFAAVSHCYLRPTYPDWPYNVFTMVHGRSVDECTAILESIAEKTGIREMKALYSTREYKKVRVSYFTPETYEWEEKHGSPVPA